MAAPSGGLAVEEGDEEERYRQMNPGEKSIAPFTWMISYG
jgi:hypothetical protein